MKNYLKKDDSAFYHITFPKRWESIKRDGEFKSTNGKIFVLRTCDENIVCSLAIGQLYEIYNEKEMIILKFPQAKNNFNSSEIGIDLQSNEPSMPLQNIIYRDKIQFGDIEVHSTIQCDISNIQQKAKKFDLNKEEFNEFNESFNIIYIENNIDKILRKEDDRVNLNSYSLVALEK